MPQLTPFYFVNQVTFGFGILVVMIYLFSKYFLPLVLRVLLSRTLIVKL